MRMVERGEGEGEGGREGEHVDFCLSFIVK